MLGIDCMNKLYERIANDIAADIQQGIYLSGEKIPSVRTLSQQNPSVLALFRRLMACLKIKD
jgi:DNA-binding transcriptional regulator YhcF (GntR family)